MEQVTLKLVGAGRFISVPTGIVSPVTRGNTVSVDKDKADYLLTLVTYDKANNAHPIFTKDMQAPVIGEKILTPLDEAVKSGRGRRRSN